jgi:hypothetical protein
MRLIEGGGTATGDSGGYSSGGSSGLFDARESFGVQTNSNSQTSGNWGAGWETGPGSDSMIGKTNTRTITEGRDRNGSTGFGKIPSPGGGKDSGFLIIITPPPGFDAPGITPDIYIDIDLDPNFGGGTGKIPNPLPPWIDPFDWWKPVLPPPLPPISENYNG